MPVTRREKKGTITFYFNNEMYESKMYVSKLMRERFIAEFTEKVSRLSNHENSYWEISPYIEDENYMIRISMTELSLIKQRHIKGDYVTISKQQGFHESTLIQQLNNRKVNIKLYEAVKSFYGI